MVEENPERRFYRELGEHASYYAYHETENLLLGFAKEYAQIVIKSLFTANGGALFLLPPILGALKSESIEDFYYAALFYSVGISASVTAALFAYYSSTYAFKTFRSLMDIDYKNLQLKHFTSCYPLTWVEQVTQEKRDLETELDSQGSKSEIWACLGVVMASISLACFIAGTLSFLLNI